MKRALNVHFSAWAVCQMVRLWPGILEDSDQHIIPSEAPMAVFVDLKELIHRYLTSLEKLINDSKARPTQINFMATMFRVLLNLMMAGFYDEEDVQALGHDGSISLSDELLELMHLIIPVLSIEMEPASKIYHDLIVMQTRALAVLDAAVELRMSKRIDLVVRLLSETNRQAVGDFRIFHPDHDIEKLEIFHPDSDIPIETRSSRTPDGQEGRLSRNRIDNKKMSSENPLAGHAAGGSSEVAVDLEGQGAEDMSLQAFALLAMPSEVDKYAEAFETEESDSVRFKLGDTIVETVDDEVDTPPVSSDT